MLVALATKIRQCEPALLAHDVAGYAAQQLGDFAIIPGAGGCTWDMEQFQIDLIPLRH
jgi:hypothetical protein